MKDTQRTLWDSLWLRPITKAAFAAWLHYRQAAAVQVWPARERSAAKADRISARFGLRDFILRFQQAPR